MRVICVICISALAAVFCGCMPAVSIRPLYTDADLSGEGAYGASGCSCAARGVRT